MAWAWCSPDPACPARLWTACASRFPPLNAPGFGEVGRRPAQDVFRDDRQGIADTVRGIIQSTLDSYQAGLTINAISIEDAAPPR